MDTHYGITTRQLAPRATQMLTDAAGTELICRHGCVWITQYGDDRDIVLQAGQSYVLDLPTAVVMSSCHGAELTLRAALPAPRRGWLARLAGWLDPRSGSAVTRELAERLGRLPGAAVERSIRPH